jgi:hypothetical protein
VRSADPCELTIQVDDRTEHGFMSVRLLVDGADILASGRRSGYSGYQPEQVLTEHSPLLPQIPPRRVGLYRCSCGEGGDGNISAVVLEQVDGRISWTGFRGDYEGWFEDPIEDNEPPPDLGGWEPIPLPDLVFDGEQYRAEVRRAVDAAQRDR